MFDNDVNRELFAFLDKTPNSFFAVKNIKEMLMQEGFEPLQESRPWRLVPGGKYLVTRNGSALIAFILPEGYYQGFQIYASHCDSPAFKLKANAEIVVDKKYVKLNVEKYGGMLLSTWLDRPLSVAGRVLCQTETGVVTRLVNIEEDLLVIPNVAIHMNREANEGYKFNAQIDMLPLAGDISSKGGLLKLVAEKLQVEIGDILDTELFLYNRMPATYVGINKEYIASGRLDDLQCAYAGLAGFKSCTPQESVAVYCLLDNEEVGSGTRQGAGAGFLKDVLQRINYSLGKTKEEYLMALANSLMLSADNAHAVHPNHTDKADITNKPYLNEGVVIKYSANQKYTTDAVSASLLKSIVKEKNVPLQTFYNRSDMLGGSTLGNISVTQVAVKAVDIGLPQLAMHSAYETAGAKDTKALVELARAFFSSSIYEQEDGSYSVNVK